MLRPTNLGVNNLAWWLFLAFLYVQMRGKRVSVKYFAQWGACVTVRFVSRCRCEFATVSDASRAMTQVSEADFHYLLERSWLRCCTNRFQIDHATNLSNYSETFQRQKPHKGYRFAVETAEWNPWQIIQTSRLQVLGQAIKLLTAALSLLDNKKWFKRGGAGRGGRRRGGGGGGGGLEMRATRAANKGVAWSTWRLLFKETIKF